ncbi:hypothetical protein [Actinomadura madurae]|uniref:hypothetical protein n=1 Tax=Actinomadura madurae TaxID=1993 RepID=UPI0020D21CEC|nr:hypothetical protein [Actinomadura madurae]MCP9981262.1 hypothetical protein [Actinomadura madurae]
MTDVPAVRLRPVVSWPARVEPGGSYRVSVDLETEGPPDEWPYPEEEYAVGCMLDGGTGFAVESVGDTTLVVHRFGGTYGPVTFVAHALDAQGDELCLTLVTQGGVPFRTIPLNVDRSVLMDAGGRLRGRRARACLLARPVPAGAGGDRGPVEPAAEQSARGGQPVHPLHRTRGRAAPAPVVARRGRGNRAAAARAGRAGQDQAGRRVRPAVPAGRLAGARGPARRAIRAGRRLSARRAARRARCRRTVARRGLRGDVADRGPAGHARRERVGQVGDGARPSHRPSRGRLVGGRWRAGSGTAASRPPRWSWSPCWGTGGCGARGS